MIDNYDFRQLKFMHARYKHRRLLNLIYLKNKNNNLQELYFPLSVYYYHLLYDAYFLFVIIIIMILKIYFLRFKSIYNCVFCRRFIDGTQFKYSYLFICLFICNVRINSFIVVVLIQTYIYRFRNSFPT